ncbi:XdhC family protein [Tropicimonas isoalkanivorans]|uniref:Xanthine dehydrogenase accessory factor n=1 Tax=Tropicimonas isoalkanivorans TaxID=441112 RepID=A0A1I1DHN9_9RHOB|nr:XdhC family protein [Tropicimonas isoalkanivorans]SFB74489.1 xanthine dehydrogenase accessory factor [Tropicimonas isoalkanivorans]
MRGEPHPRPVDPDHAALAVACEPGVALCTIVGIDGAFSRRIGAQLAIRPDGITAGDFADNCLERQLVTDVGELTAPEVRRYGRGSEKIDFRLPCGGGLDILLDPLPDRDAVRRAMDDLHARRPTRLDLPGLPYREFLPALRLRLFGKGPEMTAVADLARMMDIEIQVLSTDTLSFGRPSALPKADPWTAILLLFHDHDWEIALIEEAMSSEAFYIGAQGSRATHDRRLADLSTRGVVVDERLGSPVGVIPSCKTPRLFALSTLTEVVAAYDRLRDDA